MKRIFNSFVAIATSMFALVGCNNDSLQEVATETHSIAFVAGTPETKTSVSQGKDEAGNTVANYSWEKDDENRFSVYEIVGDNYSEAISVLAELDPDSGKMSIMAGFDGAATPGAKYFATLNKEVKAEQNGDESSYDQYSDVLVSEVVTSTEIEDEILELRFKRETAFALMTAKNIEGAYLLGASIVADKVIAAEYDYVQKSFNTEGSKSIIVSDNGDVISEISGNQAKVFVATVPVENACLTVGIVTADENNNYKAAYEKSFSEGKSISFTRGDVHAFSIGMTLSTGLVIDLTKDETTTATESEISWNRPLVSIVNTKDESQTNANNYYPGTSGKNYTSTRFYKGSTLTISPKAGLSISEIVYEATTEGYATSLANSAWTNAKASANGSTVTIIPIDGTQAVGASINNTTGASSIVIRYGIPEVISAHSVSIDNKIEHGTITATPNSGVMPGTEVVLSFDAEDGYCLDSWIVTNAATGAEISANDNKFTMPNADVNVSATVKEATSLIVTFSFVTHPAGWPGTKAEAAEGEYTYTVDGRDYVFTHSKTGDGIYLNGTSGSSGYLLIASGNKLGLPAVSGYTLAKVVGTLNNTGSPSTSSSVSITDGASIISGGTAQTWSTKGGSYTYDLTSTSEAKQYYLEVSNKNCQIINLSLTYEKAKEVVSVAVSGTASNLTYTAGDKFDKTGLVATATYEDNTTKDVTNEATWVVTPDILTAGTTSISVVATYNNVTSDVYTVSGLTVTEPVVLSSITVKTAPAKVTYTEGDKFDPSGLVITRHYSDESSDDYAYAGHTSEFTFSPALTAPLATTDTEVTITYQEMTVNQAITVNEKQIPTFSSLEALAGADLDSGTIVKVSFENVPIKSIFVTNQGYRNGIYFDIQKGDHDIEIYYQDVPEGWMEGGTVSGTMTCPWKYFANGNTWELAPEQGDWDWNNLTYDGPLAPCETPDISFTSEGYATIKCATDGAIIFYTLGASPEDPTNASSRYTGAVPMTDGQTIKAIAYKEGMSPSAICEETYTVGNDAVYKTALFGSAYNSKAVSSYTGSFSATNNGFTVDLANFNNNNNGWAFVKTGNKTNASVGTITTNAAIDKAITKVVITIDAVTATSINSITLYSGSSASSCTTNEGTFTVSQGAQTVTISSPVANKFYKISFDCKKGSSNGLVQVSKIEYYSAK